MTEAISCPISIDQLDAPVLRNAGPKAPAPLKLMTARGMAPMPPKELVTAQFVLTFDPDEKVNKAAKKSLAGLDERIANAVLSDTTVDPYVLGALASLHAANDAYAEKLLLNPKTPSLAFVDVAAGCSEAISEIIANNQARILEEPEIVRSLASNENTLKSAIDRVIDFMVRNGIILEGLPQFEEALLRLNGAERIAAANAVDIPEDLLDAQFLSDDEQGERRLIEEGDEGEAQEEDTRTLDQRMREMNIAQKVALATKGNKTVRTSLMRDTNRVVALSAITSPAITEPEVIAAAQSKVVHSDVIMHIAKDKKNNWTRNYQVKVALVNNPKTPLPSAMTLVPLLNKRDIKAVSKSKNVPMGVRNRANQLIKATGRRG